MYPSIFQCTVLAALVGVALANIMAVSPDGSLVPWGLLPRAPGDGGLAVRLANYNDTAYLATVVMGTPPQLVQMSASLSQNFISIASPPPGVNDSTYYQPAISSTYNPSNEMGTITTDSGGSITGRFVGEICMLKSATSALNFTYNASLLLTDPSVTNDLYPLAARGVLGYGVNAPTTAPANASLIPSFLPANFTNAVCGIELNHLDDPVPDGVFTMGAVDPSAYTGDFTNVIVPQTSTTSWSIPCDEIKYLAYGVPQTMTGLLTSIDLYHTGIQVTTDMARLLYSGVPGSSAVSSTVWSIPCNSTFPITLTFGTTPFVINERDTIVKLSNGTCRGVVTGGAQGMAQVGAPFMRNVYTQFGAQKASNGSLSFFVGFATKNLRGKTTTSTTTPPRPTTTTTPVAPVTTTAVGAASGASRMVVQDIRLFSTLVATSIVAIIALW